MKSDMQKKSATKTTARVATDLAPAGISPAKMLPSRDEIARRAYEIYVARGKVEGREMEDWIQAERELSGKNHRNN